MTTMQKVLPVLHWFNTIQVEKLEENADKPHWDTLSIDELIFNLNCEFNELSLAISSKDQYEAIRECADIANFAMMIADKLKTCEFDKIQLEIKNDNS